MRKLWGYVATACGAILGVLLFILGRRSSNADGGGVRDVERELDETGRNQRDASEGIRRAGDHAETIAGASRDIANGVERLDKSVERQRAGVDESGRIIDESRDILARARRRAQAENILDGSD